MIIDITRWDDLVDVMSIHIFLVKSQYEAFMDMKRSKNIIDENLKEPNNKIRFQRD